MALNEVGTNVLDDYHRDGFVSGIPILTPHETAIHRQHLESAESVFGSSLHYVNKVHTALKSPLELQRRFERGVHLIDVMQRTPEDTFRAF